MKNTLLKKVLLWIRNIALFLVGLIILFALIEACIFIASNVGRETIVVGSRERTYRVHLPPAYSKSEPLPMVLALHMYSGTGRMMEWITHFNQVADQNGFIVVYPDGYKNSWADGSNQFAADQAHIDDIAFISTLIDKLTADIAVDPTRIYATGFSNGGFMALRLACVLPDRIAAVAVVAASLPKNIFPDCKPLLPMPVMMIHGTADQSVPWNGSPEYVSVPEMVSYWVGVNGCNSTPNTTLDPDRVIDGTHIRRRSYSECKNDAEVVLDIIENGSHAWPGGNLPIQFWGVFGRISKNIDASVEIWQFFKQHNRPPTH